MADQHYSGLGESNHRGSESTLEFAQPWTGSPFPNSRRMPHTILAFGLALLPVFGFWGCVTAGGPDVGTVTSATQERTGSAARVTGAAAPGIPPGVTLDDGLTADEAVAVALWNNAAFQASLNDLGFARADLAEAGLLANPVLSLLLPVGPKQLESHAALAARPSDVARRAARGLGARQLDVHGVGAFTGEDLHRQPVLVEGERAGGERVEGTGWVVRLVEVEHRRPVVPQVRVEEACRRVGFVSA